MPGPQEYDVPAGMTFDVFKAEYHKLKVQAASQNYTGKPYNLDRRIRHTIKICWGHKCHACKRVIDLKFNVDPVYRQLSKRDAAKWKRVKTAFHTMCWNDYRRRKNAERERERRLQMAATFMEKYGLDTSDDVGTDTSVESEPAKEDERP